MLTNENSQRNKGREKMPVMGRKRQAVADADIILGFKVAPALVKALDAESETMTRERGLGASPVSRTETIKIRKNFFIEYSFDMSAVFRTLACGL